MLGKLVRDRRTFLGKTQEDVCTVARISQPALSNIERGKTRRPQYWVLKGLAKALKVTMSQLDEALEAQS